MILLLILQTTFARLIAVIEIACEPISTPKYFFSWNNQELGLITSPGIQQQKNLGGKIKELYSEVITTNFYNKSSVFIKNTDPAIIGFQTQMKEIFDEGIQPQLKLIESTQDFLLSPEKSCNRIIYLLQKNEEKFESHELYLKVLKKKEHFSGIMGNISVRNFYELGDLLISYEEQGLDLPINISIEDILLVKEIYNRYHDWLLYGSIEQGKLGLTNLINKLCSFIRSTFRSDHTQRFLPIIMDKALFLAFLHIIGLDYSPKPSGSAIFIELHSIANKNSVRFYLKDKYIESSICGLECTIDEVVQYLEGKTLKISVENACNVLGDLQEDYNFKYVVAFAILIILIIFAKYSKTITERLNKNKKE